MTVREKVSFVMDLIQCNYNLFLWEHDLQGKLLGQKTDGEALVYTLFSSSKCMDTILQHVSRYQEKKTDTVCPPVIVTDLLDLMWFAVFDTSSDENRIYVVGPAFTSEYSRQLLYPLLKNRPELIPQYHSILKVLQQVAVISTQNLMNYAISMHYAVTGEHIRSSQIRPLATPHQNLDAQRYRMENQQNASYLGIWQNEQQLLKCIEDGNDQILEPFSKLRRVSYGIRLPQSIPLRQEKDSYIIFLALCVNAGIRGGLSPTIAYSIQNTYIGKLEAATSQTELIRLGNTFFSDLTERVRNIKSQQSLSQPILSCRDYIDTHPFDALSVDDLASRVGYTNYYLTRKFKQEMGVSVSEYVRNVRIEQAKLLLTTTELSVQEIGEKLHFCTRSYFAETFQKVTGLRPNEYRKQNARNG